MTKLDDYITSVLMRDLVGHDKRPASFLVYLWLAAEAQRQGSPVLVSYQDLAEATGLSRSSAQSATGWLVRRKLLSVEKETVTAVPLYTVRSPWKR